MTTHYPRTLAAAALTATGLLLTACHSSPSQPATQAANPPPSAISHSPLAAATAGTPVDTAAPASTSSSTGQASAASACALITEHDATAALGADPGPGEESPGHCIYAAGAASMNIIVQSLPDGAASFGRLRTAQGSHAVDVSDVGDGAFGTFDGPIAVVNFYKGNTMVAVELALTGASTSSQNQTTALAKIAAGRI
jgi:hypothetical protein